MSESVVIVGGGVIGLSCAHYLRDMGYAVTVIDRNTIGGGCSHANCGYIAPSHVLPLTEPGMVGMAIRSMFKRDSPFKVKPRLSLSLMRFMLGFARRCNHRDMLAGGRALQPLLEASMASYKELVQYPQIQCEWNPNGMLYVFGSNRALDHFGQIDALITREFGTAAAPIDASGLTQMEPALRDGLAGGYFYDCDATLRADRLNSSWRAWLEERGVTFIERCQMSELIREGDRLRAIHTSSGELAADQFVFAIGARSADIAAQLRCRIPVQPGKGYSITMDRPDPCPTHSMLFPESRVGVTPYQGAYRLGSMMEFVGFDESIAPHRISLLRLGVEPYLKAPHMPHEHEQWFGFRPMTPDTLPIIGPVPRCPNGYLATGHNMIGLTLAPVTGRLIAEMISGSQTVVDPTPYSVDRF
jgi:D-amino-acid dehydrogenase